MPDDPFAIDAHPLDGPARVAGAAVRSPARRAAETVARPFLSRLLALNACRALYDRVRIAGAPFERAVLDALGVRIECADADVDLIPQHGAVVLAANHPHGALDGLVLLALAHRVRPDVRLLANHVLARIPELEPLCFFVDPFGGPAAAARSRAGLRAAHLWLRGGGALVAFPAGEVAHDAVDGGPAPADSPWSATVARLGLATGAQVVPAFIEGRNSRLFYFAGRLHPRLRTALLPRELLWKKGVSVRVRLGLPVATRDLSDQPQAATAAIRRQVERLTGDISSSSSAIAAEVAQLPGEQCLAASGALRACWATSEQIPCTLREIGRLREAAFGAAGEGTGRSVDLDVFDGRYQHLFVWDEERRLVVGAYRFGRTDEILSRHGVDGLYTRTLFHYDDRLFRELPPALELGRSFVRAEYQRSPFALLLLWKGIGRFVVRHPQYRVLFGAVSISRRYDDGTRARLMAFLEHNHRSVLAPFVRPLNARTPAIPVHESVPRTVDEADRLIAALEADGKGMPVLLRQYLKLNARLIGFNLDPTFGDALDALMMVDLASVERGILCRYMGAEGAAAFLAHHRAGGRQAAMEPAQAVLSTRDTDHAHFATHETRICGIDGSRDADRSDRTDCVRTLTVPQPSLSPGFDAA